MRAFFTLAAVTLAFLGFACLLGTAPVVAFWVAVPAAVLLTLLAAPVEGIGSNISATAHLEGLRVTVWTRVGEGS